MSGVFNEACFALFIRRKSLGCVKYIAKTMKKIINIAKETINIQAETYL